MENETTTQAEYTVNLTPLLLPIAVITASVIIAISNIISANGIVASLSKLSIGANSQISQSDQLTTEQTQILSSDQIQAIFNSEDHIVLGDVNSDNLIIEFSDPSCPFCHYAGGKNPELNNMSNSIFKMVADGGTYVPPVPEIKKLVDEGKAAYIWAYANGHSNGTIAAQAFYCAYDQGKFWEVHDLLMSYDGYNLINEVVLNDVSKIPDLVNFIKSAVDTNQMTECLQSETYKDEIQRDFDIALSTGENFGGTPMYVVNDGGVHGAQDFSAFKSYLKL